MDLKRTKINVLGVAIDDITFDDALEKILNFSQNTKNHYVVTVNSEFVMLARKNQNFAKILNNADLKIADGIGVVWAKLFFGGSAHNRITGVDLVEKLCQKASERAIGVGFLGGFSDVAKRLAQRQEKKYPALKVLLAEPGDPAIGYDLRLRSKMAKIGRVDILFVAYGMGKQEFWIARNKNSLNVGVFIGVGGAFDYIVSVKKRAPKPLQSMGFEWLFRLFLEPSRFWRMRVLPIFMLLIFKEKLLKILRPINNK